MERKIFLSSLSIPDNLKEDFWQFVNLDPSKTKIGYIANASDDYAQRDWAFTTKAYFIEMGASVKDLDLRRYSKDFDGLKSDLSKCDLIWAGPGDPIPLLSIMTTSGFTQIIGDLLDQGVIYAGESAGSIVAGPIVLADANDDLLPGLNICTFLPLPHWDDPNHLDDYKHIIKEYSNTDYEIIKIRDDQAVFVEDGNYKLA